ncbi:MAG: hypothetical protein A2860_02315 [Candidatus Levybacteria bacterium RIFCSPHIGHO2_01_FULL_37_33]|nr:MAG: hypothetical protein A2860_02315 [Candidatus Levybacteria bacterium RIFCSPHIGHO2_01_FULL_37_33]OGH16893.1 MAG: hypothetical protein A3C97_03450 [Candidatus Levybacteria bacterium RIFCSPHIGHO2_02_FULL_37_11]OGH29687.1 MAG: hypothetical protein A3F30_02100 [Candidatus Levybacteria bacterium RIFCSPHIGHO2_12_FULL_37_12]OGH32684.1 MAG: hypothetical protein A2953_01450 [Candidatus Levybacteria bacterium RIFCSPLOWO2_01_FULL_36_54]
MKIGIDARLFNQTGVGRYTSNLIENLLKIDKNNNYVLFVRNEDFDQVKLKIKNLTRSTSSGQELKIIRVDIPWHSIKEQVYFSQILNNENLDLVHFPYFSVPISYNRPFIVTIHDLIIHHFPTGKASTHPSFIYMLKILGYKYVISRACKNAKKIIAVSKATKDEIVDHLKIPEDKISVIYEAADQQISNPKSQIANKSINTKYFLYVGNVYPHKNVEKLINAFEILLQYFPNAELIFAGKEDYFYKRLKNFVKKLGHEKNIKFSGYVPDEELSNLYKNAVALVVPSLMEGFGLPPLEAMSNMCLVLASDIKALKEICGEDALYFDPYDENDMAEKMKAAYLGEFDREIIERGFERSKEFSWRKMAKETLKIYKDAIR